MQIFNFSRLVNKFSRKITVITNSKGDFDSKGDWIEGEEKRTVIKGAVIRHRANKIYNSNGLLTDDDYAMYLIEKPPFDLIGSTVIVDNQKFKVQSKLDNSEFTGVWSFNIHYVSAFKEGN